jgi:hypothetical protein
MRRRSSAPLSAEQMIRDYLVQVSAAAQRALPKGDRLLFVGRTRAAIEAQVGPIASAEVDDVTSALTALGDPEELAKRERERLQRARRGNTPTTLWKPDKASRRDTRSRRERPGTQQARKPRRWLEGARRPAPGTEPENGPAHDVGQAAAAGPDSGLDGRGSSASSGSSGAEHGPDRGAPAGPAPGIFPDSGSAAAGRVAAGGMTDGRVGDGAQPVSGAEPVTGRRTVATGPAADGQSMEDGLMAGDDRATGDAGAAEDAGRTEDVTGARGLGEAWDGSGAGDQPARLVGRPGGSAGTEPLSIVPGMESPDDDEEPRGSQRLGRPEVLTVVWALVRQQPLESVSLLFLGVGGLLYPFPLWLIGGLVSVKSRRWDRRDKWLAFLGPPLFTLAMLIVLGITGPGDFFVAFGHATHHFGLLLRVGCLLCAVFLGWRLHRGPRRKPVPPWQRRR